MSTQTPVTPERRSFFSRLSTGAASIAAVAMGGAAAAQVKSAAAPRWEPARHEKDDWFDKIPGKHRLVFDTTTPDGFGDAMAFTNNYLTANRTEYGLQNSDLAIVIVARHRSTAFAYNDAMWAKYGVPLAARARTEDPKTKQPPVINIYAASGYNDQLPNRGVTLDVLFRQGVQLAVCSVSTRNYSGGIAAALGLNADAVYTDLVANLVSNARMVPAGIIAVGRAQERGYSLASA